MTQQLEQVGVDTARRLAKVGRLIEQQQKFDAQVAAALERMSFAKQLQKRIRRAAANPNLRPQRPFRQFEIAIG